MRFITKSDRLSANDDQSEKKKMDLKKMNLKKMNRNKLSTWILCILLTFSIFSFIPVAFADSTPEEWGPKPWPWQKGGQPAWFFKKPAGNWIGGWPFLFPGANWPLIVGDPGIPHDDYSYFIIGWQVSDYEIEMEWDPGPPYKFLLFIDDEKIPMKRWARNFKDVEMGPFPDDGAYRIVDIDVSMFVASFDPYYFEPGVYEIRLQMLVKNPYFESDGAGSNKWRFYENHLSGGWYPEAFEDWYGPAGLEWNQVHYLHVV